MDMDHLPSTLRKHIMDLSSFAAHVDTALNGEQLYEHRHDFVGYYEDLLDDPYHGLYPILCHLVQIVPHQTSDTSIVDDSVRISEPPIGQEVVVNNAIRHFRDYVVLRDLRKLLQRIRSDIRKATR